MSHEEFDDFVSQNVFKDHSMRWTCGICNQSTFLNKLDVIRHIESRHVILPEIFCNICGKPSKTRNALRMHKKNYHSSTTM